MRICMYAEFLGGFFKPGMGVQMGSSRGGALDIPTTLAGTGGSTIA